MLHMEAHFRHWIKYKKGNCTQIIPNSVFFFSQFQVYIFAILTFFLGIAWYDLAVANLVSIGWYKLRIAKKNSELRDINLQMRENNSDLFFSELRVYISQLQVKSELWDINSQFWEHIIFFFPLRIGLYNSKLQIYISQFWEKNRGIPRKKSQNFEIHNRICKEKSQNLAFLTSRNWELL